MICSQGRKKSFLSKVAELDGYEEHVITGMVFLPYINRVTDRIGKLLETNRI